MTSKEIAMATARDITRNYNTALGYGFWQREAERAVSDAFNAARDNRKSVTAVADEIVKCSFAMSQRFGDCMCMAVGAALKSWLGFGLLQGYEIKRARKMLAD